MWQWIHSVSDTRRGRRAAVRAILPLVDRSRARLSGISDRVWLDPYIVGFLVMLITLSARREVVDLEGQPLCVVQSRAWGEITGLNSDLIGEEVLLLSSSQDGDFEEGCRNAIKFDDSFLVGAETHLNRALPPTLQTYNVPLANDQVAWEEMRSSAWESYFDAHVSVLVAEIVRRR